MAKIKSQMFGLGHLLLVLAASYSATPAAAGSSSSSSAIKVLRLLPSTIPRVGNSTVTAYLTSPLCKASTPQRPDARQQEDPPDRPRTAQLVLPKAGPEGQDMTFPGTVAPDCGSITFNTSTSAPSDSRAKTKVPRRGEYVPLVIPCDMDALGFEPTEEAQVLKVLEPRRLRLAQPWLQAPSSPGATWALLLQLDGPALLPVSASVRVSEPGTVMFLTSTKVMWQPGEEGPRALQLHLRRPPMQGNRLLFTLGAVEGAEAAGPDQPGGSTSLWLDVPRVAFRPHQVVQRVVAPPGPAPQEGGSSSDGDGSGGSGPSSGTPATNLTGASTNISSNGSSGSSISNGMGVVEVPLEVSGSSSGFASFVQYNLYLMYTQGCDPRTAQALRQALNVSGTLLLYPGQLSAGPLRLQLNWSAVPYEAELRIGLRFASLYNAVAGPVGSLALQPPWARPPPAAAPAPPSPLRPLRSPPAGATAAAAMQVAVGEGSGSAGTSSPPSTGSLQQGTAAGAAGGVGASTNVSAAGGGGGAGADTDAVVAVFVFGTPEGHCPAGTLSHGSATAAHYNYDRGTGQPLQYVYLSVCPTSFEGPSGSSASGSTSPPLVRDLEPPFSTEGQRYSAVLPFNASCASIQAQPRSAADLVTVTNSTCQDVDVPEIPQHAQAVLGTTANATVAAVAGAAFLLGSSSSSSSVAGSYSVGVSRQRSPCRLRLTFHRPLPPSPPARLPPRGPSSPSSPSSTAPSEKVVLPGSSSSSSSAIQQAKIAASTPDATSAPWGPPGSATDAAAGPGLKATESAGGPPATAQAAAAAAAVAADEREDTTDGDGYDGGDGDDSGDDGGGQFQELWMPQHPGGQPPAVADCHGSSGSSGNSSGSSNSTCADLTGVHSASGNGTGDGSGSSAEIQGPWIQGYEPYAEYEIQITRLSDPMDLKLSSLSYQDLSTSHFLVLCGMPAQLLQLMQQQQDPAVGAEAGSRSMDAVADLQRAIQGLATVNASDSSNSSISRAGRLSLMLQLGAMQVPAGLSAGSSSSSTGYNYLLLPAPGNTSSTPRQWVVVVNPQYQPECSPGTWIHVDLDLLGPGYSLVPELLRPGAAQVQVHGSFVMGGSLAEEAARAGSSNGSSTNKNYSHNATADASVGAAAGSTLGNGSTSADREFRIPIVVRASDNYTTCTYTLAITNGGSPDSSGSSSSSGSGGSIPAADSNRPGPPSPASPVPGSGSKPGSVYIQLMDPSTQVLLGSSLTGSGQAALAAQIFGSRDPSWPPAPAQACTICPPGTFSAGLDSRSCQLCPPGHYADLPMSGACGVCPPGSFAYQWGAVRCRPCLQGSYSPHNGSAACKMCPGGRTSEQEGSSSCSAKLALRPGPGGVGVEGELSSLGGGKPYVVLLQFGVLLSLPDPGRLSVSNTGINASSTHILQLLVAADTADLLNITTRQVSVSSVQRVQWDVYQVNVSAAVPWDQRAAPPRAAAPTGSTAGRAMRSAIAADQGGAAGGGSSPDHSSGSSSSGSSNSTGNVATIESDEGGANATAGANSSSSGSGGVVQGWIAARTSSAASSESDYSPGSVPATSAGDSASSTAESLSDVPSTDVARLSQGGSATASTPSTPSVAPAGSSSGTASAPGSSNGGYSSSSSSEAPEDVDADGLVDRLLADPSSAFVRTTRTTGGQVSVTHVEQKVVRVDMGGGGVSIHVILWPVLAGAALLAGAAVATCLRCRRVKRGVVLGGSAAAFYRWDDGGGAGELELPGHGGAAGLGDAGGPAHHQPHASLGHGGSNLLARFRPRASSKSNLAALALAAEAHHAQLQHHHHHHRLDPIAGGAQATSTFNPAAAAAALGLFGRESFR